MKKNEKAGKEITNTSLSVIDEITPLLMSITIPKIVDEQTLKTSTEVLSQANVYLKRLKDDKDLMVKPLNEALKEIKSRYKPLEDKLDTIVDTIRKDMSQYQTEQIRLQKMEEDKIAARIGSGSGKLKLETAIAKMEALDKPVEKVAADTGSLSFRSTPTLKVTNQKNIPIEFYDLNESRLLNALKAGRIIEGAEIVIVQTPINKRIY